MYVYRYEDRNGNGPFFFKNGIKRNNFPLVIHSNPSNWISGCLSIPELLYWFDNYGPLLSNDFQIVRYEVDGVILADTHIYFNRKNARRRTVIDENEIN